MPERAHPPRASRASQILGLISIALAGLAITAVALIAAGVFDPEPYGPLVHTDELDPLTLSAAQAPIYLEQLPPWSGPAAPDRFSVRLTAAYSTGELDSGYGLALDGQAGRLVVAVFPLGYVTVLGTESDGEEDAFVPWQPWPHVETETAMNEIWLDVDNTDGRARVTVWINRERLWQEAMDQPLTTVGLWAATYGEPVTIDFQTLEWYAVQP